ncbi:MAG: bifunctional folylpolyglutamate synthase/dihydrofolate synthase, partial [Peptostreptococcaceae bacterium]
GAHNEDGAKSLAKALGQNLKGKNLTLVLGMLEDKDIDGVLEILMPVFNKVITTTPDNPRAINANILKEKVCKYVDNVVAKEEIKDAVNYALETVENNEIIVSAGSLYMIGEVRSLVRRQ